MDDIELLVYKLNEYRDSLNEELKNLSHNQEREDLVKELAELNNRVGEIKVKIKAASQTSKQNKDKILAIARKLKAIKQLV